MKSITNREMKEKIIKILESQFSVVEYEDPDTGFTESTTIDVLTTDEFPDIVDKFEILVNQEVEKRIAERMPVLIKYWSRRRVVDDPDLEELLRLDDLFESIYQANRRIDFGMAADMGMECVIKEIFRSRLTKTEGGTK